MRRRTFLGVLGTIPWFAFARDATAQEKMPRIGYLTPNSEGFSNEEGFRQGLREMGYSEGKNIIIEWRRAKESYDEFGPLAAELVRMQVDVIATVGTPAARAALSATKTIPVVLGAVANPEVSGLVASLAKPGSNGTGISVLSTELAGKRLDFLRQLAPHARRIAYLANLANPASAILADPVQTAASALGMSVQTFNARSTRDVDATLRAIPWKATDGMVVMGDSFLMQERAKIAAAVRAARIPAVFPFREYHEYGVLMSYGPNLRDIGRRAAYYVDKILKGAKPAELPIEQVTRVDLVIDLRVARELGIKVPAELMYRADEVIQ